MRATQKKLTPAGLEPAISGSVDRCLIHWATGPSETLFVCLSDSCVPSWRAGFSLALEPKVLTAIGCERRCSLVVEHLLRKQEVAGSIPVVGFMSAPGCGKRIPTTWVQKFEIASKLRWSSGYDACFTRRRSAVRSRHEVFASMNEKAIRQKLPGGFEPPSLDSKSRVLTVTPWERLHLEETRHCRS